MAVIVETKPCAWCGKVSTIELTDEEYAALGTTYIQVALPDRSADERELLISGTHPSCFDAMFPVEDE